MNRPAHRPPSRSRLEPEVERELAWLIANGVTVDEAARQLRTPVPNVRHAMKTSSFAHDLDRAVAGRLKHGAPEAVDVLFGIMRDPAMPGRVRVDAAKAVLDRAGHVAGPSPADAGLGMDPNGMSIDELSALIARLDREKSDRATLVGGTGAGPSDEPPSDFMD